MKTKICVILDSDGHFGVSKLEDRTATIKLLKKIADGDCQANDAEVYMDELSLVEDELLTTSEEVWFEFVKDFEQRGMMEITEI